MIMLKQKIIIAGLFLSVLLSASDKNEAAITQYLKQGIAKESARQLKEASLNSIRFLNSKKIDDTWTGYFVALKVDVMESGSIETLPLTSILFTDGKRVIEEIQTPLAQEIKQDLVPKINPSMYGLDHHVAGNINAKHKIVVFSDPICPGCRKAIPQILNRVRNNPAEFSLYFYHYPLERIHPEAVNIVKGMIALQGMGKKDVIDRVYKEEIQNIDDLKGLYGNFKITKKDIQHYKNDLEVTEKLAVGGTPTLYYDGVADPRGKKFFNK